MGFFKKIFDHQHKELAKFTKIADEIDALDEEMTKASDSKLKEKTKEFKKRLESGETLDDIIVEAFAVVREAAKRTIGLKPFYVQLVGGLALHYGNISEMKTGEGKTLVATMPAYLNALTGKGVHIITVNEYLASRDAEWMGEVYKFLGLTVGVNLRELSPVEKQNIYNCDILYSTNNEVGFDYLRDNMVVKAEDRVQKKLNFAIVDEVDSVLIDEARTPLIISGGQMQSANLYIQADRFAKTLKENKGYLYDEKTKVATLDDTGVAQAEKAFGVDNLYDISHTTLVHFINQALKANFGMKKDFDYVVNEGKIIIVDPFTGRLMEGRQYSEGLHQAIEAKEGVQINEETKTLATITFQNLFRMYNKLSGMTGTAKTEEEEFRDIYNMYVIEIPTNKPIARIDESDLIFATVKGKYKALVEEIKRRNELGQPILVGTVAVETNELLSTLLKKAGVKHEVLNAKNHLREAEIIANAGVKGSVTIATNMAGRGTDIKLGANVDFEVAKEMTKKGYGKETITLVSSSLSQDVDKQAKKDYDEIYEKVKKEVEAKEKEIVELGGLCVLGTERHEARRIDNQLRGRSGRQGDPGFSQFYVSFEDDLMVRFGTDRAKIMLQRIGFTDDSSIQVGMLSKSIESAQKQVEGNNFDTRKHLLEYDNVVNEQREIIYERRNEILDSESIRATILNTMRNYIESLVNSHLVESGSLTGQSLNEILELVNGRLLKKKMTLDDFEKLSPDEIINLISNNLVIEYEEKMNEHPSEITNEFEKAITLRVIDTHWMEHINSMALLREGIQLRSYAQENPLRAYTAEGFDLFDKMMEVIDKEITMYLTRAEIRQNVVRQQVIQGNAVNDSSKVKKAQPKKVNKIGRNEPCPCNSGKKYKQCCGR